MNETASLVLKVDASQTVKAEKSLDGLTKSGKKAEKATDGLTNSFGRALGPLTGVVSAMAALKKLSDVTRTFQTLNASLEVATGSAEGASTAFAALQTFAAKTPYSVEQATEAFIKLRNMGLDPSERSMMSYGNTAASMGKDLDQMIEAVADAATGEFERLKEFGIKSKSEGDKVSFTFQGVTTQIGKNAEEIEGYLRGLGENQFAGAMEKQAATLEGAISNLGDSWDRMFFTISEQGAGDLITSSVRLAEEAVTALTTTLASGQLEGRISAFGGQFARASEGIVGSLEIVNQFLGDSSEGWAENGGGAADFIIGAFANLPANIKAAIELATIELAVLVDKALIYDSEITEALNPQNWFSDSATASLEERLRAVDDARESSIEGIINERNESIATFEAEIVAADNARAAFEAAHEAAAASTEDKLSGFKIENEEGSEDDITPKQQKALDQLNNYLDYGRTAELAAYEERKAIINANISDEGKRSEALQALADRHEKTLTKINLRGLSEREKFEKKSAKDKTKYVLGELESLTAGVSEKNRAMFEVNKIASIANAVMSTYEGANKALSLGPWGIPIAAAIVAAGIANVATISSTSFGGGATAVGSSPITTAPSNYNLSPTEPSIISQETPEEEREKKGVTIVINGNVSGTDGEKLLEELKVLINEQDYVLIDAQSNNAKEILAA